MRTTKILCLLVALVVAVRADAGTVLVFDKAGNIVSNYVDPTTPYSYGKMQTETSGLLYKKLGSMGLDVTDVKVTKTVQAVESVATGAASGARAGFGGGWIGMVVGAVIGAVANYAIGLGLDKAVSWLFGSGNQVTTATAGGSVGPLTSGASSWYSANCALVSQGLASGSGYGSTAAAADQACVSAVAAVLADSSKNTGGWQAVEVTTDAGVCGKTAYGQGNGNSALDGVCMGVYSPGLQSLQSGWWNTGFPGPVLSSGGSFPGPTCASGAAYDTPSGIVCVGQLVSMAVASGASGVPSQSTWTSNGSVSATSSIATAAASVPSSERAQPINPELVAAGTNGLWQQASQQPDYQGVPYDPSNPITTQDATDWASANSGYAPTVDDGLGTGTGAGTQGQPGSGGSIGALPISN